MSGKAEIIYLWNIILPRAFLKYAGTNYGSIDWLPIITSTEVIWHMSADTILGKIPVSRDLQM